MNARDQQQAGNVLKASSRDARAMIGLLAMICAHHDIFINKQYLWNTVPLQHAPFKKTMGNTFVDNTAPEAAGELDEGFVSSW